MLVRCNKTTASQLLPHEAEHFNHYVNNSEIYLVRGQLYIVFGVLLRDGIPWFLISEEPGDDWPIPHYSGLFEVVDARIPPGWSFTLESSNVGPYALLPDLWASDPAFFEKLVDDDAAAIASFHQLKERLRIWHEEVQIS